jgi:hypothetical protein
MVVLLPQEELYSQVKKILSLLRALAINAKCNRYSVYSFLDVLLMAAECEVETGGDLELARGYVNKYGKSRKYASRAGTSEADISVALVG